MPQTEEAKHRASRAYVLRLQGVTYAEIADRLDMTIEEAFLVVARLDGRDDTAPPAIAKVEKTAEEKAEARRIRRRDAARVKRAQAKQEMLATPEQLAATLVERYAVAS